jgi:hypothetical protein
MPFGSVLIGASVAGAGRSNAYKGIQLILVYVMIPILFYFLAEATPGTYDFVAGSPSRASG